MLGGVLIEHFWWGSVFLIGVPVAAMRVILGPFVLPEFRDPSDHPSGIISAGQLLLAILCLTYSVKALAQNGIGSSILVASLACLAFAWAFVRRQKRMAAALIDLSLFAKPSFAAALGANAMALFAWVGMSLLVAQHLQLCLNSRPWRPVFGPFPPAAASVLGCLAAPTPRAVSSLRASCCSRCSRSRPLYSPWRCSRTYWSCRPSLQV